MDERIEELLAQMTLEEKVAMVGGTDMWHAAGVERLRVPPLKVTDGPNGARGAQLSGGPTSTCFPCGTALGATWNPELVGRVGAALGEEARSKGAHVLLAPTVNIQRSPLAGRHFECYSEDPHLTSRITVAFVKGVQSRNVSASVKHYVCNDSEFERHTISSEVSERALREVYLPPFEAAVREADAWSVMAAYNKVNGTYATESAELLTDILKGEWGFRGFVVSDWLATKSTVAAANAGLDLEMPGPPICMGQHLLAAVRQGHVAEQAVDDKVRRLLRVRMLAGAFEQPAGSTERAVDRPEDRRLARQVAGESIVLLRNEKRGLPLDASLIKSLAVIGPNANVAHIQGGGSSRVTSHYAVTPLDGITARCGRAVDVAYEPGCINHKMLNPIDARYVASTADPTRSGLVTEYFNNRDLAGDPVLTMLSRAVHFTWLGPSLPEVDPQCFSVRCAGTFTAPQSGSYTFGLTSVGLSRLFIDGREVLDNWSKQEPGGDSFYGLGTKEVTVEIPMVADRAYDLRIEYSNEGAPIMAGLRAGCLPPVPADAMERAVAAAARADAAVVVVGMNSDWETEGNDRADMELPGRQAELIERVAAVNARTVVVLNAGAPVAVDWVERVAGLVVAWYPGQECGNAIADVLFGDVSPSGRLPQTWPARLEDCPAFLDDPGENGRLQYAEDVFVGYRYYDEKGIEPRFPFGHGLSYTSFDYGRLRASADRYAPDETIEVSLEVVNTGARRGAEVVQLYVRDVDSRLARPAKELKAFRKVALEAGESQTVRFALDRAAFSFWDPAEKKWVVEAGEFEFLAGSSSRDIRATTRITMLC